MPEGSGKKKILLVEDDIFMIELLAKELGNAGFDVVIAKTGKEGVEKCFANKPDLILLDLTLPDQNGIDSLRQIRRSEEGREIKVIILSNIAEGPDLDEAKRLMIVDYLVKANYTLREIVARVQKVFQ